MAAGGFLPGLPKTGLATRVEIVRDTCLLILKLELGNQAAKW